MRLPVPQPRTVHWLAIVLFSALVALLATPAHAQTDVPSNWPLIPSGLNAGDEFRLLLVTKRSMPATSNDISDYDAHVQSNISDRGHAHIHAYGQAISRSWACHGYGQRAQPHRDDGNRRRSHLLDQRVASCGRLRRFL